MREQGSVCFGNESGKALQHMGAGTDVYGPNDLEQNLPYRGKLLSPHIASFPLSTIFLLILVLVDV